jgi:phosphotransferase system HPr (HPr) family protein
MVTRELTLTNELGLHARAAATMVFAIGGFSSQILVRRGEKTANARSILDLMLLGASSGSVIHITASGEDEEFAIAAISALVLAGFGGTGKGKGN